MPRLSQQGTWSQKHVLYLLPDSGRCGQKTDFFSTAFWETERQLCSCPPTLSFCGTKAHSSPGKQLGPQTQTVLPEQAISCPKQHTGTLWRFHQKDKCQCTDGSGTSGRRNQGLLRGCCSDYHTTEPLCKHQLPKSPPSSNIPTNTCSHSPSSERILTCTDLKVVMNGSMMW